jgi:predicted ATP-grasp superfamily ATP-dependent carboligase
MIQMKIGVLEWVSGGGLSTEGQLEPPAGLLAEGWAMLSLVMEQLAAAGHEVLSIVDAVITTQADFIAWQDKMALAAKSGGTISLYPMPSLQGNQAIWDTWIKVARQCDQCLIIAPEIDGILERTIDRLSRQQIPLLNCSGVFLKNCCDKWKTAQLLLADDLPHPPTWTACQAHKIPTDLSDSWCCKSRWGAGCDSVVVVDAMAMANHCKRLGNSSDWIVQPWIPGESYSCSAIVDRAGVAHWLPMTTQDIVVEQSADGASTVVYQGGRVLPQKLQQQRPLEILERALPLLAGGTSDGCLGWIGFDLLRHPDGKWFIIEVNPRITSSITGLSKAAPCNLAEILLLPQWDPSNDPLSGEWSEIEFRLK